MPETRHLLIIEDDPDIRESLAMGLEFEGFRVAAVASGSEGLRYLEAQPVDCLILDVLLPGGNGYSVLKELRQGRHRSLPVIMLSALDEVADRVRGLKYGADDYVVKPYDLSELVARIEAVLRRGQTPASLHYHDLVLEPDKLRAKRGERLLQLTPKEYQLLQGFVENSERVLSKETLMAHVWGELVDPNTLEVHLSSLRRELGEPPLIHTLRGLGYILDAERA
jgi:two-component system response regulator MprA